MDASKLPQYFEKTRNNAKHHVPKKNPHNIDSKSTILKSSCPTRTDNSILKSLKYTHILRALEQSVSSINNKKNKKNYN
jgi:hypothetical protein